jgi:hypothetical protein
VTGPSERQIQRAILRRMAELLPPEAVWLHVPNQGPSPEFTRALLGDGMKPGAPDLFVFHEGRAFGLEIKRPGERLSPVQCAFHDRLAGAGVPVATVFSVAGAECTLHGWGLLDGEEAVAASWAP